MSWAVIVLLTALALLWSSCKAATVVGSSQGCCALGRSCQHLRLCLVPPCQRWNIDRLCSAAALSHTNIHPNKHKDGDVQQPHLVYQKFTNPKGYRSKLFVQVPADVHARSVVKNKLKLHPSPVKELLVTSSPLVYNGTTSDSPEAQTHGNSSTKNPDEANTTSWGLHNVFTVSVLKGGSGNVGDSVSDLQRENKVHVSSSLKNNYSNRYKVLKFQRSTVKNHHPEYPKFTNLYLQLAKPSFGFENGYAIKSPDGFKSKFVLLGTKKIPVGLHHHRGLENKLKMGKTPQNNEVAKDLLVTSHSHGIKSTEDREKSVPGAQHGLKRPRRQLHISSSRSEGCTVSASSSHEGVSVAFGDGNCGRGKGKKRPTLRVGDFPQLPSMYDFPQLPSMPDFPQLPSMPDFPQLPSMPDFPQFPSMPDFPQFPSMPDFPQLPRMPDLPQPPMIPSVPDLPRMPFF